jgi:excisionase family DNA binding protein
MQTEVLTIKEVANYLRLPEEVILQEAAQGHLPGRKIADTWRFLKAAIDDWLRTQDSRSILLNQAGALADDESLDDLLEKIYRERGRSETEEEAIS